MTPLRVRSQRVVEHALELGVLELGEDGTDRPRLALAGHEGEAPRDEFVEDHAERVDVGDIRRPRRRVAREQFRGQVLRVAELHAEGRRQPRTRRIRISLRVTYVKLFQEPTYAEIDNFYADLGSAEEHDIRGGEIAMNDAARVRGANARACLQADLDHLRGRKAQSAVPHLAERFAVEQFHHEEELPGARPFSRPGRAARPVGLVGHLIDGKDADDVGVVDRRQRDGLPSEPLAAVLAQAQFRVEELDGDVTAERQAVAAEDHAHPALANQLAPLDLPRQHAGRRRLLADEPGCIRVVVEAAPARAAVVVVDVLGVAVDGVVVNHDVRDRAHYRFFVLVSTTQRQHGDRPLEADATISRQGELGHAQRGARRS